MSTEGSNFPSSVSALSDKLIDKAGIGAGALSFVGASLVGPSFDADSPAKGALTGGASMGAKSLGASSGSSAKARFSCVVGEGGAGGAMLSPSVLRSMSPVAMVGVSGCALAPALLVAEPLAPALSVSLSTTVLTP
jgi:hypothetical protein